MGKASKFKAIRKLAKTLPEMNRNGIETSILSGQELIDKGVKTISTGVNCKTDVVAKATYKQKKVVTLPVNHNRNLKDAFKKAGTAGIEVYMSAARDVADRLKASSVK